MITVLTVRDLLIQYPEEPPVISGFAAELRTGRIVLLSGTAGSGRTSLCLALVGLLTEARPEAQLAGEVLWRGSPLPQGSIHPEHAITLENAQAQLTWFKSSVAEEIAFGLEMRGVDSSSIFARVHESAVRFGVAHLLERDPRKLSGGETARVILACSHVLRPRLWILDDALVELDAAGRGDAVAELARMAIEDDSLVIVAESTSGDLAAVATLIVEVATGRTTETLAREIPQEETPACALRLEKTRLASALASGGRPSVSAEGVAFRYGGELPLLFSDLNFDLFPGECMWILGPNGAGKTTLAHLIAGIMHPTLGDIIVAGQPSRTARVAQVAQRVGYALQNPDLQIVADSVEDELAFGPRVLKWSDSAVKQAVARALETFALTTVAEAHPHSLSRRLRKRVGLASVIAMKPEVLILDEPTQWQTDEDKLMIARALIASLAEGRAALCITHDDKWRQLVTKLLNAGLPQARRC